MAAASSVASKGAPLTGARGQMRSCGCASQAPRSAYVPVNSAQLLAARTEGGPGDQLAILG